MCREPATLQLRYLQTLVEIAVEKNSTILFPLPMDLIEPITQILRNAAGNQRQVTPPNNQSPAPLSPTSPPSAALPPGTANEA